MTNPQPTGPNKNPGASEAQKKQEEKNQAGNQAEQAQPADTAANKG